MRKTLTVCCLLVGLFGGLDLSARAVDPTARPTSAHVPGPHVRGASPRMTYLLQQAIRFSIATGEYPGRCARSDLNPPRNAKTFFQSHLQ